MNLTNLSNYFMEIFEQSHTRTFFAPGRVNLIGEHTDYNGGNVFPCAITHGTYGLVNIREDSTVRLYSLNFPEVGFIEFDIYDLDYKKDHNWANYPKGVIKYMIDETKTNITGMDILVYGNIPNGAGLSSSASLELLTAVMVNDIFELGLNRLKLIEIGKEVENKFIGVNSGIMDQFAIGMGKKDSGILLDCQTMKYEYAPIKFDDYDLIIMNTNKRRELADSKYNERRSECENALELLQTVVKIDSLGQLDCEGFERNSHVIGDIILEKRAKHAIYENQRTIDALKELKLGNLVRFGELMNESHVSLKNDYEVTGVELDTLAETAWGQPGVIGARMTGAGFGGCAIAIVEKAVTEQFIASVGEIYKEKIGYEATFYVANIGDGARELK